MVEASTLARLALFADLSAPELETIAHAVDEERYPRDARVLRAGISGANFHVILDGEAAVHIDGVDRVRLGPGEFFGEISILTGNPVLADVVVASEEMRCAVLPGPELRSLLLKHPPIALRMLEFGARRLRDTTQWAS